MIIYDDASKFEKGIISFHMGVFPEQFMGNLGYFSLTWANATDYRKG